MNGWTFILIGVGFLSVVLGSLIAARDWKKPVNFAFLSLSLAVACWVFGIAGFMASHDDAVAFLCAKVFYIAPLFIVLTLTYFSYLFPDERKLTKSFAIASSVPVVILSICLAVIPHFITKEIVHHPWGKQMEVDQAQYLLYACTIIGLFILSYLTLFLKLRVLKGLYYKQAQWFLVSGIITSLIGGWFNIVVAHWMGDFRYVWIGPLATTLYLLSTGFSIIRHHMFDIRIAAVRTVAYLLSIIALSGVYFGLAYLMSMTILKESVTTGISMSPVNIFLALVLALVFQPIKQFFDRVTNHIFYRDRYVTEEFIERLGKLLTSTVVIEDLLKRSAEEIASTLKAGFATFAIYHDKGETLVVNNGSSEHIFDDDIGLTKRLLEIVPPGSVVTVDDEPIAAYSREMRRLARRNVALVLSLGQNVGYLLLGEQKGSGYTRRDTSVLETIANELVIAIQNARSVEEVQELNEGLQRRVSAATKELRGSNKKLLALDATKDEFISMASHQLRTPLTSVKGYLSMVLEGDAGEITPSQRKLLEEAYVSSERMVHLIGDFLNVSRLQTGKFMLEPKLTDMAKMVEEEVEGMRQISGSHGIKIQYHAPEMCPQLYVDDGKLRQVVMNFIDNAVYYSPDARPVKVSVTVEDGSVALRVKDTGLGVPKEAQAKLFTKFFRAENARKQRPDGTGVGLFLARKVIDAHGGSIIFESTEGKGSTFGFRLPIKKLSSPPASEIEPN